MKNIVLILLPVLVLLTCNGNKNQHQESNVAEEDFVTYSFDLAEKQLENAILHYQDLTQFPRSTNPDGSLHIGKANNWVSGFFPGCLWYLYEYTNDSRWKDTAEKWTEALIDQQNNTGTHDVGFIINCSFGNGLRLTENEAYKPILINTANSLMTRYNENVGCTKSWDWSKEWNFPVIIDNMMNLELLFEASKLSGDESYKNAAIHHATTTMMNHYRPDISSYHVVDYDPASGEIRERVTHQGYSDGSAWARGQAWGLYGYVMCYRETKREAYLEHAKKIASFLMNHPNTPVDLVPYWDYDAPNIPDEPRDASAAAIMASALLELSRYTPNSAAMYVNYAESILRSLASDTYLAAPNMNNNFILKHSTGSMPGNTEVDSPLIYADYYFLEALLRYKHLEMNN